MKILLLCVMSIIAATVYGYDVPKIKNLENGWFTQHFDKPKISYYVDVISGQCFAAGEGVGGLTVINCENLKYRDEWRGIIKW